jgi:phage/plasmid-associated DNA primase
MHDLQLVVLESPPRKSVSPRVNTDVRLPLANLLLANDKSKTFLPGDEGGALIIDRLQTYTGFKLVFCNEKWFYYDGSVWGVDVNGRLASQICRVELNKISKAYKKETEKEKEKKKEAASDADGKSSQAEEEKKFTKEKLVNFNFNAKMSQIMTTLKGYCLETAFEESLNTNRDALPLQNGVILLKSGILVPHHPKVGI